MLCLIVRVSLSGSVKVRMVSEAGMYFDDVSERRLCSTF